MARICIWGDSIVRGHEDLEKGGWVNRLSEYCRQRFDDFYICNLGISGNDTRTLLKRFEVECRARKPEIILFAIGVNDSWYYNSKEKPNVSLDEFGENLKKLFDQAKRHSDNVAFVGIMRVVGEKLSPIPWRPEVSLDDETTKKYDLALKEFCQEEEVPYLYMYDLLSGEELKEDGLHPGPAGHEKMFQRVKGFLEENDFLKDEK